jgi:ribosome maturation factor RimP
MGRVGANEKDRSSGAVLHATKPIAPAGASVHRVRLARGARGIAVLYPAQGGGASASAEGASACYDRGRTRSRRPLAGGTPLAMAARAAAERRARRAATEGGSAMDLTSVAREVLEPLGYEVLEVSLGRAGGDRRLLVRIDRIDERAVSLDDVHRASRALGLELDRLDPIDGAYRLEVESPGSRRPLSTARHFERFRDLLLKVRTEGVTHLCRVRSVEDGSIVVEIEGETSPRRWRVADVEMAQLVEWPSAPR